MANGQGRAGQSDGTHLDDNWETAIVTNLIHQTHYLELNAEWVGSTHGDINVFIQEVVTFANAVKAEHRYPSGASHMDVGALRRSHDQHRMGIQAWEEWHGADDGVYHNTGDTTGPP